MSATFGRRGDFFLYQSERKALNDFLEDCYDYLKGKCFAVTAFDSGPLSSSEDDLILGWTQNRVTAYSSGYESSDRFCLPTNGLGD